MSPPRLRMFGPKLPPKMVAARRATRLKQRKILVAKREEERIAMTERLLAGTEKGKTAGGLAVDRSQFSRILAAFSGDRWSEALNQAAMAEANRLRDIMVKSLVEQRGGLRKPFAKLSKATIALRRSKARAKEGGRVKGSKALIATAQMFRSISVVRRGKTIFIGVPRTAKRKGQKTKSLMSIATIQEEGLVMKMTEKQSKWFWAQMSKADNAQARSILRSQKKGKQKSSVKKSARLLIVPPRPWIGPSIEAWQSGLSSRLETFLKPSLTGGP